MIDEALNLLEGEDNRLLYLPAVTLGYLFTISGSTLDFVLAIFLAAGGRALSDIVGKVQEKHDMGDDLTTDVSESVSERNQGFVALLAVILILYLVGTARGWYQLYKLFDHTDLVIVAISIGYCAVFLIVLANTISNDS